MSFPTLDSHLAEMLNFLRWNFPANIKSAKHIPHNIYVSSHDYFINTTHEKEDTSMGISEINEDIPQDTSQNNSFISNSPAIIPDLAESESLDPNTFVSPITISDHHSLTDNPVPIAIRKSSRNAPPPAHLKDYVCSSTITSACQYPIQ
ncbi:unnamed protein product [Vicia faba]|uniref:Uncharacterized protein n=1 Tax=Vicia faba TaxID=3906 RepID=A0AAV0ZJZ2_VICFA|nr:unnamed protein product [Vicia faba]